MEQHRAPAACGVAGGWQIASQQTRFHFTSPTRSTAQTSAASDKAEPWSKEHQPGFAGLLKIGRNNSWDCCGKFGVFGVFNRALPNLL